MLSVVMFASTHEQGSSKYFLFNNQAATIVSYGKWNLNALVYGSKSSYLKLKKFHMLYHAYKIEHQCQMDINISA